MNTWNFNVSQFYIYCKDKEIETIEHLYLKVEISQALWQYFSTAAGFKPLLYFKNNVRKWWGFDASSRVKGVY